jgi:hypothetical protein
VREAKEVLWVVVALLLLLLLMWQLTPLMHEEEEGIRPLYPPLLPTPAAAACTTEWSQIDTSFIGQRVCVRGSLHAADRMESYFGEGSHVLHLLRGVGPHIALHEGDCVMAGGIVKSDEAHSLYIRPDSIGLCPPDLPAWWPWGH